VSNIRIKLLSLCRNHVVLDQSDAITRTKTDSSQVYSFDPHCDSRTLQTLPLSQWLAEKMSNARKSLFQTGILGSE
jgi:hypothetical protein